LNAAGAALTVDPEEASQLLVDQPWVHPFLDG
jgi:hypothetical protein